MATDVTMPRLSDSMEEGTVLKWLVEQGGQVKRGEPLVEIETDKANMTYDADTDGTLIEVVAGEGDTLPIGETIARIGDASEASQDGSGGGESGAGEGGSGEGGSGEGKSSADENGSGSREEGAEVATAEREQGGAASDGEAATDGGAPQGNGAGSRAPADGDGRIKASPVARRVAGEQGVDLSTIEGSGPGGRIVKADVHAAAEGGDGAAEGARTGAARPGPRARSTSRSSPASSGRSRAVWPSRRRRRPTTRSRPRSI